MRGSTRPSGSLIEREWSTRRSTRTPTASERVPPGEAVAAGVPGQQVNANARSSAAAARPGARPRLRVSAEGDTGATTRARVDREEVPAVGDEPAVDALLRVRHELDRVAAGPDSRTR